MRRVRGFMQEANRTKWKFFLAMIIFLLASCTTQHARYGTAYDQMQQTLQESIAQDKKLGHKSTTHVPRAVSNALLPSIIPTVGSNNISREHRFNVSADKMPAKDFFMGLVEGTPINMVVNPNVGGTISVNLKNVTLEEAMDMVHDAYGYEYKRTSYGYEVLPQEMETEMFTVNYLNLRRTGKSMIELSSGQISEKISGPTGTSYTNPSMTTTTTQPSGSSVDTRSEMNFWRDLNTTLVTMIGSKDGRSVIVNPQADIVIVHALPNELHQVERYLSRIQTTMDRQVILEAKILEVELNDEYHAGIDWNIFGKGRPLTNDGGASQNSRTAFPIGNQPSLNDFQNIFTLNAGKGSFNLIIRLLQTQGQVQVLSSPRLSTVNNQKAVIKVGDDRFFVTGVSTQNTVTANSTIPTQDVTLTPFFSGITFDVTPQISNDKSIILHIHPSVSKVREETQTIQLGQTALNQPNTLVLPLAASTIRESDNIVRAKNGQVIVIGGLMSTDMREEIAQIPGLGKIPFVGTLFRRTQQVAVKSELVILLKPTVVTNRSWINDMEDSSRHLKTLKRGFHVGAAPDVFGNEGETENSTVNTTVAENSVRTYK